MDCWRCRTGTHLGGGLSESRRHGDWLCSTGFRTSCIRHLSPGGTLLLWTSCCSIALEQQLHCGQSSASGLAHPGGTASTRVLASANRAGSAHAGDLLEFQLEVLAFAPLLEPIDL